MGMPSLKTAKTVFFWPQPVCRRKRAEVLHSEGLSRFPHLVFAKKVDIGRLGEALFESNGGILDIAGYTRATEHVVDRSSFHKIHTLWIPDPAREALKGSAGRPVLLSQVL
jgi:hypothetical protein